VTIDSKADEASGQVIIQVSDTGPGFTPEQRTKYNAPMPGVCVCCVYIFFLVWLL
jgi:C4-dicarboxylate-specific signal transduction histidine kinase